jgi:hypothetical protein
MFWTRFCAYFFFSIIPRVYIIYINFLMFCKHFLRGVIFICADSWCPCIWSRRRVHKLVDLCRCFTNKNVAKQYSQGNKSLLRKIFTENQSSSFLFQLNFIYSIQKTFGYDHFFIFGFSLLAFFFLCRFKQNLVIALDFVNTFCTVI